MTLAFVLDVEREDVVGQVFPSWSAFNQRVRVLQDMSDAILEIGHTSRTGIPRCDIVVASLSVRAVERWEVVLGDVSIVSPAAQLVAVVDCNGELDVYRNVKLVRERGW